MAKHERVAFLGLGIMGKPMAAHICRHGYALTVWNRTREKAEAFSELHRGVEVAGTPAEAAADADIVITMVPDGPEVEEVLLGADGAVEGLHAGGLAVDMSTIAPTQTRTIATALSKRDIHFVDAPVTG